MLAIDSIARRYSILPHEVLELDPWQVGLAYQCISVAMADQRDQVQRISRGSEGSMIPAPIPVVIVGG